MNLYSKKQRWKIFLLICAFLIVGASLWYTSYIASKIRKEERTKVELWSESMKQKANLVYIINQSFSRIREEEQMNAKHWARATEELGNISLDENFDITFAFDIMKDNSAHVPVILTDGNDQYSNSNNIEFDLPEGLSPEERDARINELIKPLIAEWSQTHEPIIISLKGSTNKVYYTDSKLIQNLENERDSIMRSFNEELTQNSVLVPFVYIDATTDSIENTNIEGLRKLSKDELSARLEEMKKVNAPIIVQLSDEKKGYIYFEDSYVLKQLRYYPYIQFSIIGLFLIVAYFLFSTFRKAEQNQVWVGMAKETAHQLGTPLSSLMAWLDLLEEKGVDKASLAEMNKDVKRLETITTRFSKIGSEGKLEPVTVKRIIADVVDYLQPRVSKNVAFEIQHDDENVTAAINPPLFEWVIENLTKNAVDSMEGKGSITFSTSYDQKNVYIDIKDTGKGIPASKFKTVFEPGFTTKQRGWGLGLSLVKRIVEQYHDGKIFVASSSPEQGTTFRISLKRA